MQNSNGPVAAFYGLRESSQDKSGPARGFPVYRPGRVRRGIARGLLWSALLLLVACEGKPVPTPPHPPKVTITNPVRQKVTDCLEVNGNTQAVNTVQLRARVEGYLEKVLFRDGDMVKKDQLLFLLQQNTYQAKLQQAEGNVLTQKALLEHAKTELARYTNLYSQKAGAQTDVENWRYQRDTAQAALLSAEAQRDLARLDLAYTRVTAPFDGRIDRRLVDPGNLVGSGTSTVLAEIHQIQPLYVYFNVSETDISPLLKSSGNLFSGQGKKSSSQVYLGLANEEGYPHEGVLDFAATTVSSTTGTLLLRGIFPNEDRRVLPGQFARVRIPVGEERSMLLVPKVAVSHDQLGSFLLVVNDNKVVERRDVKTGTAKDDLYVIQEGLSGNEQVIVKGLLRASLGRQVTPERETPEQQPAGPGSNPRE